MGRQRPIFRRRTGRWAATATAVVGIFLAVAAAPMSSGGVPWPAAGERGRGSGRSSGSSGSSHGRLSPDDGPTAASAAVAARVGRAAGTEDTVSSPAQPPLTSAERVAAATVAAAAAQAAAIEALAATAAAAKAADDALVFGGRRGTRPSGGGRPVERSWQQHYPPSRLLRLPPPTDAAVPFPRLSRRRRRRTTGEPRHTDSESDSRASDSDGDSDGGDEGSGTRGDEGDRDLRHGVEDRGGVHLRPPTSLRLSKAQLRTLRLLCGCRRHWRPRLVSERAPVSDPANRYCCSDACWASSSALGIAGRASIGKCCTKMRRPCPTAVTKLRFDF